jgi:hypothetical protein
VESGPGVGEVSALVVEYVLGVITSVSFIPQKEPLLLESRDISENALHAFCSPKQKMVPN